MMPNPDLAAWTRTDRLIKAWITATISEEALGTVVGLTTSLDVWKALSNTYSQDSQAREFELLLKLQEKKKDTVPLNDFIRNFKLTCDQLNAIGKPVPDQKKVFWLLNGLGSSYESFSTAMLKPPVPSYLDLIPLLHSHELRNNAFLTDQPNPAVAFVGQRSNPNRGSQSSFNSRGKGFHQSGSRPPYTPRNAQPQSFSKNQSQS
ncbi:UBN2_3 domain-containing protein, partial [Fagus crenata]